jgi:hypothetical protein
MKKSISGYLEISKQQTRVSGYQIPDLMTWGADILHTDILMR